MGRILNTAGLSLLLLLIALRPLIAETYDSATPAISAAIGVLEDPTPVRTVVLDLLILAAFSAIACGQALQGQRYRPSGLEGGLLVLGAAAILSCASAGNTRLAVNASLDWLCLPILTTALVQVVRNPAERRLLLAVVIASACAQVVQCVDQYFAGFHDTWEQYQRTKTEFWSRQGVNLDSPQVELFENRMLAREASGFFPHSNVAGSYLILCGLAALGNAIFVAPALILVTTLLTQSRGALVAGIGGLLGYALLWRVSPGIEVNRRKMWWATCLCALAIGLGVVAYGLMRGNLPGASLDFRWKYWTASARLIAEHPLVGVGRENFGRHYLQYKPIENPEEISNPHNLFVQAAADWGLPGLVGIFLMFVGATGRLANQWSESVPEPRHLSAIHGPPAVERTRGWCWWGVALLSALLLSRLPLLGSDNLSYLYYSTVMVGVPWLMGFGMVAIKQRREGRGNDGPRVGRTCPLAALGVGMGLLAFLVHEMINFALFVPGTATTFFALLGCCMAAQTDAHPLERQASSGKFNPFARLVRSKIGLAAPAIVSWVLLAVAIVLVIPVIRADRQMALARQSAGELVSGSIDSQPAERHFLAAAAADSWDPTPYLVRAEWLTAVSAIPHLAEPALLKALESTKQASGRDPFSLGPPRMQVRIRQLLAERTGEPEHLLAAVEAAEQALRLYPLDPPGIVKLADCQLAAGEALNSLPMLQAAAQNYRRALQLNDARPAYETIRRFRDRERADIAARIERAEKP